MKRLLTWWRRRWKTRNRHWGFC